MIIKTVLIDYLFTNAETGPFLKRIVVEHHFRTECGRSMWPISCLVYRTTRYIHNIFIRMAPVCNNSMLLHYLALSICAFCLLLSVCWPCRRSTHCCPANLLSPNGATKSIKTPLGAHYVGVVRYFAPSLNGQECERVLRWRKKKNTKQNKTPSAAQKTDLRSVITAYFPLCRSSEDLITDQWWPGVTYRWF